MLYVLDVGTKVIQRMSQINSGVHSVSSVVVLVGMVDLILDANHVAITFHWHKFKDAIHAMLDQHLYHNFAQNVVVRNRCMLCTIFHKSLSNNIIDILVKYTIFN